MADTLRSDGKTVRVTPQATYTKGSPLYVDDWAGIALTSGSSGEEVALEIAQREHEIVVGAGVTANKGDILYIHADHTVDATSSAGVAFMKVTVAKDANNVVWGILLPQTAPIA